VLWHLLQNKIRESNIFEFKEILFRNSAKVNEVTFDEDDDGGLFGLDSPPGVKRSSVDDDMFAGLLGKKNTEKASTGRSRSAGDQKSSLFDDLILGIFVILC